MTSKSKPAPGPKADQKREESGNVLRRQVTLGRAHAGGSER